VQSMPLIDISSVVDGEALASSENRVFYMQIVRYSLAGLALLLLGWFVLRPLARRIQESAEQQQAARKGPEGVLGQHQLSGEAYARLANMEQVRQSVVTEPDRANKVMREWVDPV